MIGSRGEYEHFACEFTFCVSGVIRIMDIFVHEMHREAQVSRGIHHSLLLLEWLLHVCMYIMCVCVITMGSIIYLLVCTWLFWLHADGNNKYPIREPFAPKLILIRFSYYNYIAFIVMATFIINNTRLGLRGNAGRRLHIYIAKDSCAQQERGFAEAPKQIFNYLFYALSLA